MPAEVSRRGKGKQLALLSPLTVFAVLVYWLSNKRCFVMYQLLYFFLFLSSKLWSKKL